MAVAQTRQGGVGEANVDPFGLAVEPQARPAVDAGGLVELARYVPEHAVVPQVLDLAIAVQGNHGVGEVPQRHGPHVLLAEEGFPSRCGKGVDDWAPVELRVGSGRDELSLRASLEGFPGIFRGIVKLPQPRVDGGELSGMRSNHDLGFLRPRHGDHDVLVIGPAPKVQGVSRLQPAQPVVDALPGLCLRARVGVVSPRGVHVEGRVLSGRNVAWLGQGTHRRMGCIPRLGEAQAGEARNQRDQAGEGSHSPHAVLAMLSAQARNRAFRDSSLLASGARAGRLGPLRPVRFPKSLLLPDRAPWPGSLFSAGFSAR